MFGMGKICRGGLLAALIVSVCALLSCGGSVKQAETERVDPYYMTGSPADRETLRDLFSLLAAEKSPGEDQCAIIREIANLYFRLKEYGRLIYFLNFRISLFPDDSYNGYYLLMIAYAYMQQGSFPVAARYFDLIVKNYPDLTITGESMYLACLNHLINLVDNPEQRVQYYHELISRFPEQTNLGAAYFMLGQSYERIGEWNSAIQAYTQYLPYVGTIIPGFPNADNYAKQLVDFNNSPKDWTFENLNVLVDTIKTTLDGGSSARLWRYRAKVNFFARSWEQGEADDSGMADFNLSDFMQGNRIRYAGELDEGSNASEAYLRTSGWSQYISTWYLYFRKIYFPADPEIHGRWEWAGVYYGEKF
jgi:tetratricopeptide (TPR) repeat protein